MIGIPALVDAVGPALLRVVVAVAGAEVDDLTLAELDDGVVGVPGDLVLGVGITHPERGIALLEQVARARAGGVVLRAPLAEHVDVVAAAGRNGVALIELRTHASWAHLVWLLRGTFDRTIGAQLDGAGVHGDLFAVADAAAAILDAPVTIEDAQSRVLAYSGLQELTDPARLSTIVGRRVPEQIVAHFRARGVFRKLAHSDEPIYVGAGPEGIKPRLVIPVRAAGEWLGSIWAVVEGPPPPSVVVELRRASTVVALHLLRLRAQADLTRRVTAQRLRDLLAGSATDTDWLPTGPWRVAVVGRAAPAAAVEPARDVDAELDRCASLLRRSGWRDPLVTTLEGRVHVVVAADGGPTHRTPPAGTWPWLAALVDRAQDDGDNGDDGADEGGAPWVCVGPPAGDASGLVRSGSAAAELAALRRSGGPMADGLGAAVLTAEDCWAALTTARAVGAVGDPDLLGGPVPALRAHDEERHTAYLPSLAAWLDHPGEPTAAARALGVHVNTLRYRMVRMSEVVAIPLDDPAARLALRLQLLALGH